MNRAGVPCDDDRMSLLRRGGVETPEFEAFMEHLRVCDDCWGAWLAWRCLEPDGAVQPGDEKLVARAADRTLRAWRRDLPRGRRTARAAAAAAVLLIGAMASAGIFEYQRRAGQREAIPVSPHALFASPRTRRPNEPAGQAMALPLMPAPTEADARPFRRGRSEPAPATVAALEPGPWDPGANPSAAALFEEATEARRNGQLEAAIASFERLQSDFPRTPEATVSLVSLAELFVNGGTPASALPLFDEYLARAPAGPLSPEALVGKARALDRLGRTDEARTIRLEMGRRMSGSLYVPRR